MMKPNTNPLEDFLVNPAPYNIAAVVKAVNTLIQRSAPYTGAVVTVNVSLPAIEGRKMLCDVVQWCNDNAPPLETLEPQ